MKRPAVTLHPRPETQSPTARRRLIMGAYALWVVVVLLASAPYLADTGSRTALGGGEFAYNPRFTHDGEIEHYVVERVDPGEDAFIDLDAHLDDRSVDIEAVNVRGLTVDCSSIAREKMNEIMDRDYTSDQVFQQFFHDMEYLHVHTDTTDHMKITWLHMPRPTAVVADDRPYGGEIPEAGDRIIVEAPAGTHHYILFFTEPPDMPEAVIGVDHPETLVGAEVSFDGSGSVGGKWPLTDWLWDFDVEGDEETVDDTGAGVKHRFSEPGTYRVSLTVRNEMLLEDTAHVTVQVRLEDSAIDLDGDGIPDWSDYDIDGDGFQNALESSYGTDPGDETSTPPDMDGDLIPDPEDDDRDGDGRPNSEDSHPDDGTRWDDTEQDDRSTGSSMVVVGLAIVAVLIPFLMVLFIVTRRKKRVESWGEEDHNVRRTAPGTAAPTRETAPLLKGRRSMAESETTKAGRRLSPASPSGEAPPAHAPIRETEDGTSDSLFIPVDLFMAMADRDGMERPNANRDRMERPGVDKGRREKHGVDKGASGVHGVPSKEPPNQIAGRRGGPMVGPGKKGHRISLGPKPGKLPRNEGLGGGRSASFDIPESMLNALVAAEKKRKELDKRKRRT